MDQKLENQIYRKWSKDFKDLTEHDPDGSHLSPRGAAGLYAVASIVYHQNNGNPVIPDPVFDKLCDWLIEHFDECVADGAGLLDRELLACHSGHDTRIFVKPYHDIAEVFLRHSCCCIRCKDEHKQTRTV